MSDLRVVQLRDENRSPITPYTAAASVYVNVNEEWTNVETQIGAMNIDAIKDAQESALDSIEEQRVESVTKVQEEGDSYRNDINALSGDVKTLDEKVFPLVVETGISGNTSTLTYKYSYNVKEYDRAAVGLDSVVVTRQSNGSAAESLYSGPKASGIFYPSMTWGRDIFNTTATKGRKTGKDPKTSYLCAYGAYGETINKSVIQNTLARIVTSSASFTCTVNTTTERQYIWVAVPQYLSVSKITSGGFDVTMNNYVNIEIGSINYRAYRSKNPLQISTWNLTVS